MKADPRSNPAPPAPDVARGLSAQEASRRLAEVGPNTLPEPRPPSLALMFLRQFLSPFIYILLIAGVVSLAIGQTPSAVFIAAVLLLNAVIGAVQEHSAQLSAAALRNLVRGTARVIRDGLPHQIDIADVVPGDLLVVGSGDRVAADVDLTDSRDLTVDESMLTGESLAVTKDATAAPPADAPLGDRTNQLFAGTSVTRGRGRGVVTRTGTATQIGSIAESLASDHAAEPPLMIRIRRFTYQVAGAILTAIVLLAVLMALRGGYSGVEMVMMGVGLAVSTIPEGLPAALTVALAIGMRRMADRNVIIRKLVAVEALGSCTFICSDKTGTLTVNELTIAQVVLPSGQTFTTTGAGIGPGEVKGADRAQLQALIETGVLANESRLDYAGGDWTADGDIVDVAFLVLAKKFGLSIETLQTRKARLALLPYESDRALSASLNAEADGARLFVKGSPEKILESSRAMRCEDGDRPIDAAHITAQFEALARDGYRVIALALRDAERAESIDTPQDLVFLGMVAMIDPVRPEARTAVARCRAGGVDVAMVTGDHPSTARAIGTDLGLCAADAQVVTGKEIRAAEAEGAGALTALIAPARVFARIEPAQKALIVKSLADTGHFVAVTGDGVNDAPALRRANAGVAMGKSGTDVAKEAADLIIADDNFASLVAGIEQGRIVYNNIRKVIGLLVATGFSAILLFFLCVGFGLPMPLTAVQLLWLNLVANGVQDVALAFEPGEGDELDQPPRAPDEPIFNRSILEHVFVAGSIMGVLAFAVFATVHAGGATLVEAQNTTLLMMVLFGNVHALSSRSEHRSLFNIPYFGNRFLAVATPAALAIHLACMHVPGLNSVIGIAPVDLGTFAALVGVALVFFAGEEAHKAVLRRRAVSAR